MNDVVTRRISSANNCYYVAYIRITLQCTTFQYEYLSVPGLVGTFPDDHDTRWSGSCYPELNGIPRLRLRRVGRAIQKRVFNEHACVIPRSTRVMKRSIRRSGRQALELPATIQCCSPSPLAGLIALSRNRAGASRPSGCAGPAGRSAQRGASPVMRAQSGPDDVVDVRAA